MSKKNLTDAAVRGLKPKDKTYKLSDGAISGLRVLVYPTGKRVFRLSYLFQGREQLLTLGGYPEFSLAEAREAALNAKRQIARGENPAALKKAEKVKNHVHTFHSLADEWLALRECEWSAVHIKDSKQKLDLHILPAIGSVPMAELDKAAIKVILDSLQAQGKAATLRKVRSIVSQVMRYAVELEIPGVVADLTTLLRGRQYSRPNPQHRAALTNPHEVGQLMKAIAAYEEVSVLTSLALKFSALTFARPGEVRHAEWAEIDIPNTLWRIPAAKMKMRQPHLVPLAPQTLELLERLRPISGHGKYLFPSVRSMEAPMSEATVLAAIRRMGFSKEQMSAHGFRGMASTTLNERGFNSDWVEKQLAHGERDRIRAAYNHSDFLADRRKMMRAWADLLEELAAD